MGLCFRCAYPLTSSTCHSKIHLVVLSNLCGRERRCGAELFRHTASKGGYVSPLALSRWQFGITTIYHFIFVPLTIGLALALAIMQSAHYRTRDPKYQDMLDFFSRLFAINFAIGVVTGIVQEFQFGMNWSDYSIFVGNIFGAPLAIEGLLAFFLESTFLGIWLFGKDRISARLHLFSIWMVSIGTIFSALFILAANSFMQHPVGYTVDPATHRAVMTDFFALLTNPALLTSFFHTILAAITTAAAVILAVSGYQLVKRGPNPAFAAAAKFGIVTLFLSMFFNAFVGHVQGQVMTKEQPMKMAAAEALYNTESGASFSLLTIGNLSGVPVFQIRLPHLLSVLATNSWNGEVEGINQVQASEAKQYGAGSYVPAVWITYWTFRIMVGAGIVMLLFSVVGLYYMWKKTLLRQRWFLRASIWVAALPFLANATGWIFTEMGRQPWIVYGLLKTASGVSQITSVSVFITLAGFTLIYTVLAAVDGVLMLRFSKRDISAPEPGAGHESELVY